MDVYIIIALVCVTWVGWECYAFSRNRFRLVRPGAARNVVDFRHLPDAEVRMLIAETISPSIGHDADMTAADLGESARKPDASPAASSWRDATIPGGLAAATGAADWMIVDDNVLEAVAQLTHSNIDNGLDLWGAFNEHGYKLATSGFAVKLRGHVAEQEIYDQLGWAGSDLSIPDASNQPASDLNLGGHDFNVKVGPDASTIAEHLRVHPDIPLIVNADMTDLPADALHVDLSSPIDPDILAGHSVVVADGLLLSDLHDQMADAIGSIFDSFDGGDLLDSAADLGVPVLGSVVRVIRSGVREQKLVAYHGSKRRAAENIACDVAIIGTGVAVGGTIGAGLGAAVDLASGGLTFGLGTTVVGPAIGAAIGGVVGGKSAENRRMGPLRTARSDASAAVQAYDEAATRALAEANREWTDDVLARAEHNLVDTSATLTGRVDDAMAHARTSLATSSTDLQQAAVNALRAEASILAGLPPARAITVWRARRRWQAISAAALQADDTWPVLDALCGAGSTEVVQGLLLEDAQRRARVMAGAAEVATRTEQLVQAVRADTMATLAGERLRLNQTVQKDTWPAARMVWVRGEAIRRELVATGAQKPEWVNEHLPSVPAPTPLTMTSP
jgi:hypothetical protein